MFGAPYRKISIDGGPLAYSRPYPDLVGYVRMSYLNSSWLPPADGHVLWAPYRKIPIDGMPLAYS